MSAAFGWTIEEVEYHVVNLIQSGDIQGRVDSQNKVSSELFYNHACLF
jgi:COP9 signalosome complex subunit 1